MWDRIFDQYLQVPMQKIVTDAIRPKPATTRTASPRPGASLREHLPLPRRPLDPAPWALGADFTLADCAAAPALFYADTVMPFGPDEPGSAPTSPA